MSCQGEHYWPSVSHIRDLRPPFQQEGAAIELLTKKLSKARGQGSSCQNAVKAGFSQFGGPIVRPGCVRMDSEAARPKLVIIGAGISGLSAAQYLVKNNAPCDILILEAKERTGGRIWTGKSSFSV